jgi:hypothetical protein
MHGVLSLLNPADQEQNAGIMFLLLGDLAQLYGQKMFLLMRGFPVEQKGVYPGFASEDDFKRALTLIWETKFIGWWHYDREYVSYGICTKEEFDAALEASR